MKTRRNPWHRRLVLYVSVVLVAVGCAGGRRVTPRPRRERPGLPRYESLDIAQLYGRKIVIDPGHGGRFEGAIAHNRLREADVNLNVASHLHELLRDAGADVTLTRSTDSAVAKKRNPSLIEDLEARPTLANAIGADLFLSIHHNADIVPDSQRNDLEVYYKMADPGQSMDLARRIMHSVAFTDLSLERRKLLLPGNYRVLRQSEMPAVLIEVSYLTNTENAQKLALSSTHRLQASAIFKGLVDYFGAGIPEVMFLSPPDDEMDVAVPLVMAELKPAIGGVDSTSIWVRLDGVVVAHEYDVERSRVLYLHPEPLANGEHTVAVQFRNLAGNASPVTRKTFKIARPPTTISFEARPALLPPTKTARAVLTADVRDRFLMPVADGTKVVFGGNAGWVQPQSAETVNGNAFCYFVPPQSEGKWNLWAKSARLQDGCTVETRQDVTFAIGRARSDDTRSPIAGAFVRFAPDQYVETDVNGIFILSDIGAEKRTLKIAKDGYVPLEEERTLSGNVGDWRFNMVPVADRALHGAKIAIDAEFGGAREGAIGPMGLRASLVNLSVAKYLAAMLTAAGADVLLVRPEETLMTPLERVEKVNDFGAEIYVAIGHGAAKQNSLAVLDESERLTEVPLHDVNYVAHYPTSMNGRRLAGNIARFVAKLRDEGETEIFASVAYPIVQTACPAVAVHTLEPYSVAAEELLSGSGFQRREAYAVYNGILEHYGFPKDGVARLTGQVVGEDIRRPVNGAIVALDDYLFLETMPDGKFAFELLSPGKHAVIVRTPQGDQLRVEVALEADQTRNMTVLVPGWTPPRESLPFRPALPSTPMRR
ncbi:MAG: N-acetylmuramoyl-L-alanine amidase [Candidatus Hydrogenedentes bacterium]|nr:N-acetylmuramoyl-L-alanine amidase [Candidatus Hydrogenedentota bacterium]